MDEKNTALKAELIFKIVEGMSYSEWRRIAHVIDHTFENATTRVEFTQDAAKSAKILYELQ